MMKIKNYYKWREELLYACEIGDLNRVKTAISHGANINLFMNGHTTLTISIDNNYIEIANYLIANGFTNFNVKTWSNKSPLSLAINGGHYDFAKILIDRVDTNINSHTGDSHYTPCMLALNGNNTDLAWKIADRSDFDANAVDNNWNSALLIAIKNRHFDIAEYLVVHKNCNINQRNDDNDTPLGLAIKAGDIVFARFIAEQKNCNINKRTTKGNTPLMLAITHNHLDFAGEIVARKGCNIYLRNNNRETALILAIKSKHIEFACKIAQMKHCNINAKDDKQESALSLAIKAGMNDLIAILLDVEGININLRTSERYTPLMLTITHNHLDVASEIAARGDCKIGLSNNNYETALILAIKSQHPNFASKIAQMEHCNINAKDDKQESALSLSIKADMNDLAGVILDVKDIDINLRTSKHQNTPMMLALNQLNTDLAWKIVKRPDLNVNKVDKYGNSALLIAIKTGYFDIAEYLVVHRKCDINQRNADKETPLVLAIKLGNIVFARFLAEQKNCDINKRTTDGNTPLMLAITRNHLDFAGELAVMEDCNINAKDNQQESALSLAIQAGMDDVVGVLLDVHDTDINLRTSKNKYTPMMLALEKRNTDLAWKIVQRPDFNVNQGDKYGNSALLIAIKTGYFDIAEYLVIHRHCNINQRNSSHQTSLGLAIQAGNIVFARFLAEQKNCNINKKATNGNTPLMLAITHHHLDFADELAVREDCYLGLYNNTDETALMLAIRSNHPEFAGKIAQLQNCNINAKDNQQESALSLAIQADMDDLVEILLNVNGININLHTSAEKHTPLMLALNKHNINIAWKIVPRLDFDVNEIDSYENSALLIAIKTGHFDIAEYLVVHRNLYRDPQNFHYPINQKNINNETPLGLAITSGNLVFARFLAEQKNCDINQKTTNNNTPLMLAIIHNHLDFADELAVRKDCNVGLLNNNWETALILAIRSNHIELACKIAQIKNCSVNAKDKHNESALSLAIQADMDDLVGILLDVNGININRRTSQKRYTPLMLALNKRNTDLAWKIVCRSDRNTNKVDYYKNSSLMIAIKTGYFDIAEYIVKSFLAYEAWDVNGKNYDNETPLGLAITSGNIVFARFLAQQRKCDINRETTDRNTPLTLALLQNQFDFAEELVLHPNYRINTSYNSHDRKDPLSVSARTGHFNVFKVLFNRLKKYSKLTDSDNQLFRDAIEGHNQKIINTLLERVEEIFKYAEMHRKEYGNFVDIYVSDLIETINKKKIDFLQSNPSGLFDLKPTWRRHVFYVLRYLIRRGAEQDLDIIKEILSFPSMEAIAHTAVTPGMENELLRLALRIGNQPVVLFLVSALPEVARLAEENAWYINERGGSLNLRAIAEDKESSMIALSEGERNILNKLNTYYGPAIERLGGSAQVVEKFRQVLKARYQNSPAFIETITKVPDDESVLNLLFSPLFGPLFKRRIKKKIELPFEKQDFDRMQMLPAERSKALKAYYRDCNHTAYRFLSKPNPWMHPRAAYVQSDLAGSYSYFDCYIPMIAVFFLAATDENSPPTDDFTLEGRFDLFISQLALIGRTHNWDRDEADDMEADMPSCNSGIHRRLFQSVMGHAFFVGLTKETLKLEIKDFVRQHFVNKINDANRQQISAAFFECHIHLTPNDESLELLSSINITDAEKREFYSVMASRYGEDFSSSVVLMLYTNEQFALDKGETHIGKFYGFANLQGLILKNAEQEKEEEKSNLPNQIVHSFRYRRDLDDATEVKFSAKILFKK